MPKHPLCPETGAALACALPGIKRVKCPVSRQWLGDGQSQSYSTTLPSSRWGGFPPRLQNHSQKEESPLSHTRLGDKLFAGLFALLSPAPPVAGSRHSSESLLLASAGWQRPATRRTHRVISASGQKHPTALSHKQKQHGKAQFAQSHLPSPGVGPSAEQDKNHLQEMERRDATFTSSTQRCC